MWLVRLAVLVGFVGFIVGFVLVAKFYEGELIWPPLAAGFAATALGVFLALLLERELERRRDRERARAAQRADEGKRLSEARLGFSAISEELGMLERSLIRVTAEHRRDKYLVIDLPTGSWEAARSQLGLIVSDFELMASLSRFYGRVADLQNRLRLKEQAILLNREDQVAEIENKIDEAIEQATSDVGDLTERIVEQIQQPAVRAEPTRRISAVASMPYEAVEPPTSG